MSDLEKLAALRCSRAPDNGAVKPLDLLRAAAHDLDRGEIKADSVMIVFAHCPGPNDREPWTVETYRAGCTRDREIVLLHMALTKATSDWRNGDGE